MMHNLRNNKQATKGAHAQPKEMPVKTKEVGEIQNKNFATPTFSYVTEKMH